MKIFYIFNTFFLFILLLSINNINSQKFIILPFEEYYYKNNYSTFLEFLNYQFINNIYTPLKIGTPSQTLLTFIKTDEIVFFINNDKSFYDKTNYGYNPKISSSFYNITALNGYYFYHGYSLINETINFCKDENCKNTIAFPNFQLNLVPLESYDNKSKPLTGQLGFSILINKSEREWILAIDQLKNRGYINSYKISIKYKDEHNGLLVLGEDPHIYDPNNFKEYQKLLSYIKLSPSDAYINYLLEMGKIYFYNGTENIISFKDKNLEIEFHFEYGIILGPINYYYQIKKIFFDNHNETCTQNYTHVKDKDLIVYTCKINNFNVSEFPSLFFYDKYMNYTFELNYNDLFYKNGDEYIFLIAFNRYQDEIWKMGKPFLKKYQLTFDFDSKTVLYYDTTIKKENEENNEGNTGKIILIIVIVIICGGILIVGGYFLGKKLNEVRKKRANELCDDYDYNSKDNDKNDQLYDNLNSK